MSALLANTPVLIGSGQVNVRGGGSDSPIALMVEAARAAISDTGSNHVLDRIGSVRVVRMFSRSYPNPGSLVAEQLGLKSAETVYTAAGGHIPQLLVNRAASEISAGRNDVILIGGGEAWKTRSGAKVRGEGLLWPLQDPESRPDVVVGSDRPFSNAIEDLVGVGVPTVVYPLFEVAYRNSRHLSVGDHLLSIAELWSRFSEVAVQNEHAAIPKRFTPEEILAVSPANRMISFPYTKLLNSNNSVDQGAALLMCSAETARSLGVPSDRWVFLHGAAEANDTEFVSHRRNFARSDSIRLVGDKSLELAGVGVDDLSYFDIYSCFPSAVQIAAVELGIHPDTALTVTGGLTFAGGPWNNYVTHSIATIMGRLRNDTSAYGLCTANGGFLTKHAAGVYSCVPPQRGTRWDSVQQEVDCLPTVDLVEDYEGNGEIEAYTIEHNHDSEPIKGVLAVRTPTGARAWVISEDAETLKRLFSEECCGTTARVDRLDLLELG